MMALGVEGLFFMVVIPKLLHIYIDYLLLHLLPNSFLLLYFLLYAIPYINYFVNLILLGVEYFIF